MYVTIVSSDKWYKWINLPGNIKNSFFGWVWLIWGGVKNVRDYEDAKLEDYKLEDYKLEDYKLEDLEDYEGFIERGDYELGLRLWMLFLCKNKGKGICYDDLFYVYTSIYYVSFSLFSIFYSFSF